MNNKVYEIVQQQILDMLAESEKSGEIHWVKPWNGGSPLPKSLMTDEHTYYRGINTIINPAGEYVTFNEVQKMREKDNSIQIRKGCHTHTVYYFNFMEKKDADGEIVKDEKGNPVKIPFLKFYKVFNIDDVNGLESRMPYVRNEHTLTENMKKADTYLQLFCKLSGIDMVVKKGGGRAYYSPKRHSITVPDKEQYKEIGEYYSTNFHEVSHAIDKMLSLTGDQVLDDYSSGELLAEISSQLICHRLMIDCKSSMENSVEYIRGWSRKIKEEKASYIVSIAAKASKACDYFFEMIEKELEKYNLQEAAVIAENDKIIHIGVNSDGDFEYDIYKYDIFQQKIKLLDGGIIERGGNMLNVMDALSDILDGYNISEQPLKDMDIDDFESLLSGDLQYEDLSR